MNEIRRGNSKVAIRILITAVFFSIAMGYLESAVVVYLRRIYYPEGFDFPLKIMDSRIAMVELIREFATLVMLGAVGYLGGKKTIERIAVFLFAFGWWDIFYYVFLKLILGWPPSLFTWDILFLLPVIWTGPVLAPVVNSVTMILLGTVLFIRSSAGLNARLKAREWFLLVAGSLIIFVTYIQDYLRFMLQEIPFRTLMFSGNAGLIMHRSSVYIPDFFNWWLFSAGEAGLLAAIFLYLLHMKKTKA